MIPSDTNISMLFVYQDRVFTLSYRKVCFLHV